MSSPHGLLFLFLLGTGMRPSEALALRWRDVDLDAGTAAVQRVLVATGAQVSFADPKTKKARRTVPLSASLTAALLARQAETGADRDALVFPGEHGQPLNEHNLVCRHFKAVLKAAGLPETIRLYDLRHTCATLMLANGDNPKVVQERLGHTKIMLTLDVYSHVLPTMQEQATVKRDAFLAPALTIPKGAPS